MGATGPDGSMKRSHAALVNGVRIRTFFDEVGDHQSLPVPIRRGRTGTPICGVVERFGAPSVTSADISTSCDEEFGKFSLVRGGSDVRRRVSGVHVMMDRTKEVRVRILATRSDADWTGGEIRFFVHPSPDPETIM